MEIIHTAIHVSDLDKETEFYHDVLNLSRTREWIDDGVVNYCVGNEQGIEVQLIQAQDVAVDTTRDSLDHIAVRTDDIESVLDAVSERPDCSVVDGPITPRKTVSKSRSSQVRMGMSSNSYGTYHNLLSAPSRANRNH